MRREYVIDLSNVPVRSSEGMDCFAWLQGLPVLEPIIRCKDCKYYSDHEWIIATEVSDVCHFWHGRPTKVDSHGFCAWAERREV